MVFFVKTGDNSVAWCSVQGKNSGPGTDPCGTPYESVTLSDRMSLFFTDWCLFFK